MTDEPRASRSFTLNDQIAFARLSCDWNPMHLDQAFAQRTQVGAPVVHGIHTLAWAADAVLQAFPRNVANIRARFLQPLYLDEPASIRIRTQTERAIEFEVIAANTVIALVKLSSEPGKSAAKSARPTPPATRISQPANPGFEELADQAGVVATGEGDVRTPFPTLADAIGLPAVKAMLATSHIVGMVCPGLHSLFAGLELSCHSNNDPENVLAYAVSKVDARFRSLQIEVSGSGIAGRLDAFARPVPPSQPAMAEISPRVVGSPFAGQKSLVIGGSRGLGEVTAKIIAAGGGQTFITYRVSKADAERVAADILGAGGRCEILHYDALSPAREQLEGLGAIDCGYYFATPKILQRKSALYEPEKLRAFLGVYADGLFDLSNVLAHDKAGKLTLFYPSTVAIDEGISTTAEYAMAKMAGEILTKYMNEFMPGIRVIARRLPRILTDQTATVGVASVANALDVMLPIVYDVQKTARPDPAPCG